MLNTTEKQFSILFFVIVLIELITGNVPTLMYAHYIAKPAIVVSLMVLIYNNFDKLPRHLRYTVILALLFSVIGDILLLFVNKNQHFFTAGLLAFLTAHIMYVKSFLVHRNKSRNALWFGLALLIYALALLNVLSVGLGNMLVPVMLYMVVILAMAISAYLRKNYVSDISYRLVLFGAISFMISDSILAINKFYVELPIAGILIMTTYALAQYLIVIGILKINVTNAKV